MEEITDVHSVGFLMYLPDGGGIDDIKVLLVRKIFENDGKEVPHVYKNVGITASECVENIEEEVVNFVDDKQHFLSHLKNNLRTKYGFNDSAAEFILERERQSERTYGERTLIIAFLEKARKYVMSFQYILSRKETRRDSVVNRKVYLVTEVLSQDNHQILNPDLLVGPVDAEDCKRREFYSLGVKETCEVLFQERDRIATPYYSFPVCLDTYLKEQLNFDEATKIIKEVERYRSSLGSD